jgi:hypothetical protein
VLTEEECKVQKAVRCSRIFRFSLLCEAKAAD